MKPTREQFEEWRANPITEWVFDTFVPAEMARTRKEFEAAAWEGHILPITHAAHRERHETLEWLRGLDMATIDETLEMQE